MPTPRGVAAAAAVTRWQMWRARLPAEAAVVVARAAGNAVLAIDVTVDVVLSAPVAVVVPIVVAETVGVVSVLCMPRRRRRQS